MIILSVDYGDKRTGIAVCDKLEMLASPVTVITQSYAPKVIAEIEKMDADKILEEYQHQIRSALDNNTQPDNNILRALQARASIVKSEAW